MTRNTGDDDGNVPLSALEKWSWIFESDYYQELLEKSQDWRIRRRW